MVHTIGFVGDAGAGKTSVIASMLGLTKELPKVLTPQTFSLDIQSKKTSFRFVDTDSSVDVATVLEDPKISYCDVLTYVLEYGNQDAIERFKTLWLPEIQTRKIPLFVVQNKIDLLPEGENTILDVEENVPVLLDYDRYLGSYNYSSKQFDNSNQALFLEMAKIIFYPMRHIYNFEDKSLHELAAKAFSRIFFLSDANKDGKLSHEELDDIKVKCFDESIPSIFLSVPEYQDLYLDDFLELVKGLIQSRCFPAVWDMLRAFDYNDKLVIDHEDLLYSNVEKCTSDEVLVLSDRGIQTISAFFAAIDTDKDGGLSKEEIESAFFITPSNPFQTLEGDYMRMCETTPNPETKQKMMTLNGWVSLWSLTTLRNPYSLIRTLIHWGVKDDLKEMLEKKKKRKERKSVEDYPNTIQCYMFGAPGSGKTSIGRALIKQRFRQTYEQTKKQQSFVNQVQLKGEKPLYLVVTEFEYGQVNNVLKSEELMSKCDVACLVYDVSDKYSFSHIAYVQKSLDITIPVVYIPTKMDLPIVSQEHEVTPREFCTALGFYWPPTDLSFIKDSQQKIQSIFQEIAYTAIHPENGLPNFQDEQMEEEEIESPRNPSSNGQKGKGGALFLAIGVGVAIAGFFLWKYISKAKPHAAPAAPKK